jgi:hypothetical protein
MAFIPAIISGAGLLAGLFGHKQTQTQNQSQQIFDQTQQSGGGQSQNFINYDPTAQGFRDTIIGNYSQGLANPLNLTGYQANATANINKNAGFAKQNLLENLASRGISASSPASAVATSKIDTGRFSDITQLQNSIPLLQQQYHNEILNNAGTFFRNIPYGTSIGTSYNNYGTDARNQNSTSTGTTSVNPFASGFGAMAPILAGLYGQGAFGGKGGTESLSN